MLLHRLGRTKPTKRLRACCLRLQVLLHELDRTEPRDVRAVLWGFARLRAAPSKMFMEAVCDNLVWTIDQYSCQVRGVPWVCPHAGRHCAKL